MGVIYRNAELAIRSALSRDPLPQSINVALCFGGPLELRLTRALEVYTEQLRSGHDEGILAPRPDLLARIDELAGEPRSTHSHEPAGGSAPSP